MKKFLVIGNPIEHSLSPKLHNYWLKKNNIKGSYNKELLDEAGFTPQEFVFCNFLPPFLTQHLIYLKSRSLVVKCTKN